MVLQINERTKIEDPREYGAEAVNELRNLLILGGSALRDPQRENFYELENAGHIFYIYVSPINGDVMLLARWVNSPKEVRARVAHLVA